MSVRKPSGITLKGLNISKGAGKLVRRKVDVRTVCIALEVDADASEKMHQTRRLYGQACNLLVPIVVSDTDRKKRLWQRYNLHKAAYPMVRTKNVRSWCTARLQRHAFGIEHVPVVDQQPSELLEG